MVFSSPHLPRSPLDQISSSAPSSRTTSANVPTLIKASKIHTHTHHQAKL
jgi:hypothetical protein